MEIINRRNEEIIALLQSSEIAFQRLEYIIENYRPPLNGEYFLTDRQLSERLNICRRTLQEYRTQGILPYIQFGGKILYRESDIQKLLDDNYYRAFK